MTQSSARDLTSIALIERLVAFDTTSFKTNLDAIGFIRDHLAALGVEAHLTFDDGKGKANLLATLGPSDRPGIMLSGHTDVVPVAGQPWTGDPFQVRERDGLLSGRGTTDMKSFIAACIALAPEFLRRGLDTPIHFAFSYDEEVGCLGVRRLIADMARRLPVPPRLCIVGEPTEMKVIIGHKGKKSMRGHVRGVECHSALAHEGVNAVEYAAEAIAYLKAMARRLRDNGPFDPEYEPPYTTVHTGVVQGGTALNIVPRDCWFDFEVRNLPGDDPHLLVEEVKDHVRRTLMPEMQAVDPAAGFIWEEVNYTPGLDMRHDDEATRFVTALTGANASGRVSFGTEAGLFQQAGIPTIVCGPGNIEQAHKPDEFIAVEQVAQCETFLRRLMDRVCRST